ncbi:MAG: tRNA (N(6)-L-threonylcarbamoyladenosine(37)-C(2))-methylthiotransferase MtaB [Pirellulales bacterium]|nr:tRNA (N(6)-L-threonylcarbamoyladenosine(37)-C(2))-methylthiotransferase MtaB [Pirellulales bacterium]
MDRKTLKTVTLGCKVNQYETEFLREGLAQLGYREACDGETADLCLVNTCTVTAESDRKSRKAIRHLAKENPGTRIIVMGCYATRRPEEAAALPGVVEVVTDKRELPALLERMGLPDPPEGISTFGSRHRAYVKIQDGCRMNCSYCIIPKARPVLTSRQPAEVLNEISRLVENQYREIVLTGIHLGHYGVDLEDNTPELAGLTRRIVDLDGDFRVRISSIEAAEATPELLDVMAAHPKRICPHLHLSMQSGSNTVLQRMCRRYTAREFIDRCRRVTDSLDNPALTTDVIVGFPGETESEFEETCRVAEQIGFSKIHIFRFSPRKGTSAATMPGHVPGDVQRKRFERLAEIVKPLRERFFRSLLGRRLQVLVESEIEDEEAGGLIDITGSSRAHPTRIGTSARYVPVELSDMNGEPGNLVEVRAERITDGRIVTTS